ncbi:MAG: DUF2306 domain-containing protein [Mycobacteriales bacterium]
MSAIDDVDTRQEQVGPGRRAVFLTCAVLIAIVLVFFVRRLILDVPKFGTDPQELDDINRSWIAHPWVGYLHVVPGVLYLLGASLQVSHRFRSRHYVFHRRLGRVVLAVGFLTGAFAIVFGTLYSFGGVSEAVTSAVFGVWFRTCLGTALAAIRRGEVATHRRWMIRAFAVAIGVGTIRIWIGLLAGTGLTALNTSFAVGFPLAFVIHVPAAEWWLRRAPAPAG